MAAKTGAELEALKRRRAALFSIYLQCEQPEHRSRTSSHGPSQRARENARTVRLPRLPAGMAPESLNDAVETLASDTSAAGVHSARLAMAALCRGADALDPGEHARALRRLGGTNYEPLMRVCSDVRDRKQRFLAASNLMLGCQLRNFDVVWQRHSNLVTNIEVSVETTRPIDDFKGGLMDPRKWDENLPLVWPKAYLIKDAKLPTDRALDPPAAADTTVDFKGLFYEEAAWPANFAELGLWRNVLCMDYSEKPDQVHFNFNEYECLTSRYLGIDSEGGIDCDKGFGDASKLPDGWTRVTAKKEFRFTKPDFLVVPLNAISSVWLLFLLEAFVLFGACPIQGE